jgi:hypothetical protein
MFERVRDGSRRTDCQEADALPPAGAERVAQAGRGSYRRFVVVGYTAEKADAADSAPFTLALLDDGRLVCAGALAAASTRASSRRWAPISDHGPRQAGHPRLLPVGPGTTGWVAHGRGSALQRGPPRPAATPGVLASARGQETRKVLGRGTPGAPDFAVEGDGPRPSSPFSRGKRVGDRCASPGSEPSPGPTWKSSSPISPRPSGRPSDTPRAT